MPMIDLALPRGRFDSSEQVRDLAEMFGVVRGDARWAELQFDQR